MLSKSVASHGSSGPVVGPPAGSMSASHALRAALKKFWLHGVGFGVALPGLGQSAVTFWKFPMWYW
jgi:hypothetical protein